MPITHQDNKFLKQAIELAEKGRWTCSPNPMVGAVIVKNNKCAGEGFHRKTGEAHAEIIALKDAGNSAQDATLYVTLEPCSTFGKTPPCTEAIIKAGIKRVVVGAIDPNTLHGGKGLEILEANNIEIEFADDNECKEINEKFNHFIITKTPFLHAKWAMTLDGKIATTSGDSKWISCEKSREYVHKLRSEYDAVMVGIGTVLADKPGLNVRLDGEWRSPIKIIVDSHCRTPADSKVFSGEPLIIACGKNPDKNNLKLLEKAGAEVLEFSDSESERVNLKKLLVTLGTRNISSILTEGGAKLIGSLMTQKLVDRVTVFIAPKIIGGSLAPGPVGGKGINKMSDALLSTNQQFMSFENDIMITGKLNTNPLNPPLLRGN